MNKGKLHALGCGGLVEQRRKGTGALLLPPWDPVQGERGKKGKKREREAGKEGERSGTRRNWLSSGGYWVARPAEPRGGIFKCFSLFLFLFVQTRCGMLQKLICHLSNLPKSQTVLSD